MEQTLAQQADRIVEPGEVVLWQGRPDRGVFVTASQLGRFVRTVVMLGLFVYILARLQKSLPPLWDVRVIVLFIFFQAVPSEIIRSVWRRRHTRYVLCARRALIVTDQPGFGVTMQSIPLTKDTVLEVQQGRAVGSILFPNAPKRGWSLIGEVPKPGFERLAEAAQVLSLIRQIQVNPQINEVAA